MKWLAHWYGKRIVNVNVNIIVAGLLAMAFTCGVMLLLGRAGLNERLEHRPALWHKFVISGLTFIVDLIADVAVYYALHWLANHMPKPGQKLHLNPAYAKLGFVKDASRVQFQRACLCPILYLFALGGQIGLLHLNFSIAQATAISFTVGIAVTRVLHTFWMMYEEQHLLRKHHAQLAAEAQIASQKI